MTLSICISSSGRISLLKELISSLALQSIDMKDVDVILPLNKAYESKARSALSHFHLPLSWFVTEGELNSSRSKNIGLQKSRGDILLFLDEDCAVPNRLFLKNLISYHQKYPQVTVIGGRYQNGSFETRYGTAYNLICQVWQDRQQNLQSSLSGGFLGGNLSLKLTPTTRLITFGEKFEFGGEEIEFIHHHKSKGHKCLLVNGLTVHHNAQHDLKTFFSRAWLQGKNKSYLQKESFQNVFKDREFIVKRPAKFTTKSLATAYLGVAQLSCMKQTMKNKLEAVKSTTDFENKEV